MIPSPRMKLKQLEARWRRGAQRAVDAQAAGEPSEALYATAREAWCRYETQRRLKPQDDSPCNSATPEG